jgi:hypothetical protein
MLEQGVKTLLLIEHTREDRRNDLIPAFVLALLGSHPAGGLINPFLCLVGLEESGPDHIRVEVQSISASHLRINVGSRDARKEKCTHGVENDGAQIGS